MDNILEVKNISKSFPIKGILGNLKGSVSAVDDVSFVLPRRGTLGIVGESGCGKSTLARLLMQLIRSDCGEIIMNNQNLLQASRKELLAARKKMQMVFQNPYSSLNPKMSVLDNIAFNLIVHGESHQAARKKAGYFLDAVGLASAYADRYPGSLSGGQRQRVAIARALVLEPEIIIADEAVSALDKSIQAQVLNLFKDLQEEFSLSMIFISHDLNVVEYMSDQVQVMYLGRIVESGEVERIYHNTAHPYTLALMNSAPSLEAGVSRLDADMTIKGELPSPLNPPSGCRFHTRCEFATDICKQDKPELSIIEQRHNVYCHLFSERLATVHTAS